MVANGDGTAAIADGAGPVVLDDAVCFRVSDADGAVAGARLYQELERPRNGPEFERDGDRRGYSARLRRHPVARMEYALELRFTDGSESRGPDPANPLRSPGAFGEKSELRFAGYAPPVWLDAGAVEQGSRTELTLSAPSLDRKLPAILWQSHGAGADEALPLLLVHDGPDYAHYARLLELLDQLVGSGRLQRCRACLVGPGPARDDVYSANDRYADSLATELLPAIAALAPSNGRVVGLGASLGALALLHAHSRHPGLLSGLLLQSGSFFRAETDEHERSFGPFPRIEQFVDAVVDGSAPVPPVALRLCAGSGEENLACNLALASVLARRRLPVEFSTFADAHNWTAWRDALDPTLPRLLEIAWR